MFLDSWAEDQIQRMMLGGNLKFKDFLKKYDLNKDNIHTKYKTNAAKSYRENLDNVLNGKDLEQPPEYQNGKELFKFESKMDSGGLTGFGSDDLVQKERKVDSGFKENWEKGKKTISLWGSNIGKGFNTFISKTKQKFESQKDKNQNNEQNNDSNNQQNLSKEEIAEKSKTREKFDKGLTNLKKGMGTLGSKISLGWSVFSNKTKKFAQDSQRFISEKTDQYKNSNNPDNYQSGTNPGKPIQAEDNSQNVYQRTQPEYLADFTPKERDEQQGIQKQVSKKKVEEEEVNYI